MNANLSSNKVQTLKRSHLANAISAALLASMITAPVSAKEEDKDADKIVVTATKTSQPIQEVPLAITALDGEFIDEVNLTDVKDLVAFTPGITGNSQDSFIDAISVRGIRTQDFGVGGDPSTAFFKNDLYEGRNGSVVSTLYDMDRAEILRGPQGFLFGRNSVGGAVSVHTRQADIGVDEASIALEINELNLQSLTAVKNLPISDSFAMRFAAISSQEDGFITNQFDGRDYGGHDKFAGRWSTSYESDKTKITTMVEYEDRTRNGSLYRAITNGDIWDAFDQAMGPVEIRGGDQGIDSDNYTGSIDDAQILTLGGKLEYELDFADLTVNLGHKDHDYFYTEDYDGTPISISNYTQDQTGDYTQAEVRLNSKPDDGPLSWYVGASYYKENIDTRFSFVADEDAMCQYYSHYYYLYYYGQSVQFTCSEYYGSSGFTPSADGTLTETSQIIGKYSGWATYLNIGYAITDNFDIELGIRHTSDKKQFSNNVFEPESWLGPYWAYLFSTDGPLTNTKTWDNTSYRALARWRMDEDTMVYASYTEGYKSGGFGSFSVRRADGSTPEGYPTGITFEADGFLPDEFAPEIADSYEFGLKDTWFDGNAQVDLTAFMYDYQDLQIVTYDVDAGGAALVKNVGEVESSGIEGSIKASLSTNFDIYASMAYLDSEASKLQDICGLEDPDGCEGSPLFWAPEFSGSVVLNGNFALDSGAEIVSSLEVYWESERGGGWENLASSKIDSYTDVSFRIAYQAYEDDGNWRIEAYIENLTNEFTWDGMNNNGGILPSHFFGPKKPRTAGLRFTRSWQ